MLNTVNINIQRSSDHGQWFARTESDAKTGETNVIFFQREGDQSELQKYLDSSPDVCKGHEISHTYLRALGLKTMNINNEDLNAVFQAGYKQMEAHIPFSKHEVLVSKFDEDNNPKIQIKINDTLVESAEHQKKLAHGKELSSFEPVFGASFTELTTVVRDIYNALKLAMRIRDKSHFSISPLPLIKASRTLNEFRSRGEQSSGITPNQRQEFVQKIDSLSKVLDKQFEKFNAQYEKHKSKFIEQIASSQVVFSYHKSDDKKWILTEAEKKEVKDNLSIIFSESVSKNEKGLKDRPEDRKHLEAAVSWLNDLLYSSVLNYRLQIYEVHKDDLIEKLEFCEDLLRQSEPG